MILPHQVLEILNAMAQKLVKKKQKNIVEFIIRFAQLSIVP